MKSNVQNLRLFAFSRATRSGMAIISNNSTPAAARHQPLPSFLLSFLPRLRRQELRNPSDRSGARCHLAAEVDVDDDDDRVAIQV